MQQLRKFNPATNDNGYLTGFNRFTTPFRSTSQAAERPRVRFGRSVRWHNAATMRAQSDALQKYRDVMQVPVPVLEQIRDDFVKQMRAGLDADGGSSLPMIPTLVDILPDGHEHGKFFSIDLGGTNLRVMYIKLPRTHGSVDVVEYEENPIPDHLRHCPSEELFDFLVDTLMAFADKVGWNRHERPGRKMVLGFCFSFPIQQTAPDAGRLIKWVKGFDNEDAVGKDVMKLLRDAFHRKAIKADILALVNDTLGTLASAQYGDGKNNTHTCISIIVGTGTNCCYTEQLKNIGKFRTRHLPRSPDMIINTEWADYNSEFLPRIEEDQALDASSMYPGQHAFEKMTSGLYLGDIARLITRSLAREHGLFGGEVPEQLDQWKAIRTPQMVAIAEDASEDLSDVAAVLQSQLGLQPEDVPLEARQQVQEVCQLVGLRGARLVGAAIAAILRHVGRDPAAADGSSPVNKVPVEGAVMKQYTTYRENVQAAAVELMGKGTIAIEPAPVLSGTLGAALVAAASKSYMSGLGFSDP